MARYYFDEIVDCPHGKDCQIRSKTCIECDYCKDDSGPVNGNWVDCDFLFQETDPNGISAHDPGAHYRYEFRGLKLDPYRILQIYGISSPARQHAIKKLLVAGGRGEKDLRQDLNEAKSAIDRELEMMGEDDE